MRTPIRNVDLFKTDPIDIHTAGTNLDGLILRLIDKGFTDEEILSKCYPTVDDPSRWSDRKKSFMIKLEQLRGKTGC